MRWLKLLFRVLGWLLTPLVAWAASFWGAWIGLVIARGIHNPDTGLWFTVACSITIGLTTLLLWMRLLRSSPRLRHSLHVTREGMPETGELLADPKADVTPPSSSGEPL